MRINITAVDSGKEMGFTFEMKRITMDEVWLAVKKVIEDKINEDSQ